MKWTETIESHHSHCDGVAIVYWDISKDYYQKRIKCICQEITATRRLTKNNAAIADTKDRDVEKSDTLILAMKKKWEHLKKFLCQTKTEPLFKVRFSNFDSILRTSLLSSQLDWECFTDRLAHTLPRSFQKEQRFIPFSIFKFRVSGSF